MGNGIHLKFLVAGIFFVFIIDRFLPQTENLPVLRQEPHYAAAQAPRAAQREAQQTSRPVNVRQGLWADSARFESGIKTLNITPEMKEPRPVYGPADLPAWRKYAVPIAPDPEKPKIAIVIDDLGMSAKYTKETLALPGPLTLAFLPYAEGLAGFVMTGRRRGHEVIVHMPMEPMNGALDTGPVFLSTAQTPEEFSAMLDKGLSAFGGYVGINNHMGSRLTQDREAMDRVMTVLAERGLLFLDSRTAAASVAAEAAQASHVPFATRDVFLDDDPSLENVEISLAKTEKIAREKGMAIAIGHPKPATLAALRAWLPTLDEKGIQMIPVSAAVMAPQGPLPETIARREGSGNVQRLQ